MSQSDIINRIETFLELDGSSTNSFAKLAGIDSGNVTKMLAGKQKITDNTLRKISAAHGVSFDWLKYGEGEMMTSAHDFRVANKNLRPHIPIEVAAGLTTGFAECVALRDCEMRPVVDAFPNYDYTISIKGNSMEPKYESGDIIAIKQVTDYIEWGKTYVVSTRDGAVVKRLYPPKHSDKAFECISYNDEYPAFELDKDSILALYKVVGLLRVY